MFQEVVSSTKARKGGAEEDNVGCFANDFRYGLAVMGVSWSEFVSVLLSSHSTWQERIYICLAIPTCPWCSLPEHP
jgi:hypothetical protein